MEDRDMKDKLSGNMRKWLALIAAVLLYYVIHEGSHLIDALIYGVFQKIRILGLGVQVVAQTELLTDTQTAVFCVVGCVSTLLAAYLLMTAAKPIGRRGNKMFKAVCFYTTIAFMLIDPIYLTVLYKFFGGGDMNGIILFGIPEIFLQIIFGVICLINVFLIVKKIYPAYKKSFSS